MPNKVSGMNWMKARGFTKFDIIKMELEEYSFKGGSIGLYKINKMLSAVILDFPTELHEQIEKQLSLEKSEVITVPFNVYLKRKGKL